VWRDEWMQQVWMCARDVVWRDEWMQQVWMCAEGGEEWSCEEGIGGGCRMVM